VGEKHIDIYLDHLLNAQQCLLLLDGFDNLPPLQRPVYLQRLNRFIDEYGEAHLGGIILVSRPEEYRIARHQLLEITQNNADFYFHTEAMLQPLTHVDAQVYLTSHTPISSENTEYLFKINGLNEFLHIPLGLILFAHTAQHSIENLDTSRSAEDIKNSLIENYVQEQLLNAINKSGYSPQQTKTWLSHLARYLNMGETFHLENLSPRILTTPAQQQHYQSTFAIIFGVVFGLMMGSVAGLIFGDRIANVDKIPQPPVTEGFFLVVYETFQFWDKYGDWGDKFNFVIIYACLGIVIALMLSRVLFLLGRRLEFSLFLGGYLAIFMGFTGWLMDGALWSFFTATFYGILGIMLGLMVDPVHTNPQVIALGQDTRFTFNRLFRDKRNLLLGLLFIPIGVGLMLAFRNAIPTLSLPLAILNGLAVGLSFTLAYLTYHLKSQQDWENQIFFSTQKLQAALKRSLIMMLSIGVIITLMVTLIGLVKLDELGSLSFGLRIGMPLGIILGFLFYGGIEILKHLALRWVVYRENLAPLNYPAFLEHTNDLHLLISRSGGYAFRHDWFQEYFLTQKA
jgi:eukaryotic-like serine/threonine-protein kinase